MDVATLSARELRDYARYLETTELDWIDYNEAPYLNYSQWRERENPIDPDVDA
jgi:hypothetical protein